MRSLGGPALPANAAPVRGPAKIAGVGLVRSRRRDPVEPDSFLAYFRGYQRPNRYWEAPDGLRYWRTRFELNRCTLDSVEPPRRVDQGAKPIRDWVGPPCPERRRCVREGVGRQVVARFEGTDMQPCLAVGGPTASLP